MKKSFTTLRSSVSLCSMSLIMALSAFLSIGLTPVDVQATLSATIATFADPSRNSSNPLFTVDFTQNKFNGEWSDAQTGLFLDIPYSGDTFTDAWFKMTEVEIIDAFGDTSGGEINFYANGTSTNPLLVISFESGSVSRYGFGADEIFVANTVTITGSEITDSLSEEMFSFSFANLAKLPGHTNWNDGFTATAAFTSSAVSIPSVPEPTTIFLLGTGGLMIWRTRRRIY